ncbi:hypothetical protein [Ruegeria faecimaris]|uniref:Dolichyl-phosphate-mannose-protein mannosyltransferase n=1 Tax=Ruegeria faecimaris TaxID=686389 RepID=A0A521CNS7_9RHOB|nr:hypothetical protein [Ruegeria faecimaris]SMO61114.1 hypothetical protein SAMN06265380_103126 [Ruegeria faecimaris]
MSDARISSFKGTTPSSTRMGAMLGIVTAGLGLVLLIAGLFGRLMTYDLRRDELMFVPPARLLGEWELYSDFFYNHVPYSAWYYLGSGILFDEFGLLGSARIGLFLAWLGLIAATGWVTLRLSGSPVLAVFSIIGIVTCELFLTGAGMAATNNLLPLPFAVIGLGLFLIETSKPAPRFLTLVLSGVALSIAAGMKVSAVLFIPPIALAAFLLPADVSMARRLKAVVLPLLIGGLIAALPLFAFLLADPGVFLAHVLGFHTGPHVAYWEANAATEPGLALRLSGKLMLAHSAWVAGVGLVMVMAILSVLWIILRGGARVDEMQPSQLRHGGVVLAIIILTASMAFVPTPGFPQYYIQPLVCLPLLLAVLFRRLDPPRRHEAVPVLAAGIVLMVILGLPRIGMGLVSLTEPSKFTSARFAGSGAVLRDAVAGSALPDGPVATLLPIYPLEAGLSVYPEFATGPFAYRIAPFTDPELAGKYVMAGANDLPALFADNPPSAFLLGYDSVLEAPLLSYARANNYRPVELSGLNNRYGQGVVYLKAAGAEQ